MIVFAPFATCNNSKQIYKFNIFFPQCCFGMDVQREVMSVFSQFSNHQIFLTNLFADYFWSGASCSIRLFSEFSLPVTPYKVPVAHSIKVNKTITLGISDSKSSHIVLANNMQFPRLRACMSRKRIAKSVTSNPSPRATAHLASPAPTNFTKPIAALNFTRSPIC